MSRATVRRHGDECRTCRACRCRSVRLGHVVSMRA
jgi:hypothetical protein